MSQSIRYNGEWTERFADESIAHWVARIPAGSTPPATGSCDHETEWTSGGANVKVCTKCGDLGAQACKDLHDATVEELQEHYFPPDP